jgi:hypothetical protein
MSLQISLLEILNGTPPHGIMGRRHWIYMQAFFDLLLFLLKMAILVEDEKEVAESRCLYSVCLKSSLFTKNARRLYICFWSLSALYKRVTISIL